MNVNLLITVFLLSCNLVCNCQEIAEEKTYRVQGYLIIQKTVESTTQEETSHTLLIDNLDLYFFKPLESVSSNSIDSLLSIQIQKDKEMFLPMGLTESENRIKQTNSDFNGYLNINPLNSFLEENKTFDKTPKTTFKLSNNKLENIVYSVVYVDGLWTKVFVPFKYKDLISTGSYTTAHLDPNKKDGYEYYFLKEIKAISYNLKFNDRLIIQIE